MLGTGEARRGFVDVVNESWKHAFPIPPPLKKKPTKSLCQAVWRVLRVEKRAAKL